MQLSLSRNKNILLRMLSILMALLILIIPVLTPFAGAAVVETLIAKYGVEILATILVGSGIGFASSDGARAAAAGCWDWMSTNATSAWNTIKAWSIKALENPGIVSNSGVRMTASLWNGNRQTQLRLPCPQYPC